MNWPGHLPSGTERENINLIDAAFPGRPVPESSRYYIFAFTRMLNLLKEPLVHFLLLGLLLFGLQYYFGNQRMEDDELIVINDDQLMQLKNNWITKWGRPPTAQELDGLVEDLIREEIFYREAERIGLGKNDIIVRRRLVQKLTFLYEAEAGELSKQMIRSYYEKHRDNYQTDEIFSFKQIYFNPDQRDTPELDAATLLSKLQAPEVVLNYQGDSGLLASVVEAQTHARVSAEFGTDFADQLRNLPLHSWQGPLHSSLGVHLVYLDKRSGRTALEFEESRPFIIDDLIDKEREKAVNRAYMRIKDNYRVERSTEPEKPETIDSE